MAQVGRLHGKVSIVTGAAGGIGEAICERFLAEGSKVMMIDCNAENLNEKYDNFIGKYKGCVAKFQCDVAIESSATEAFERSLSKFGRNCNVLVNCAAIEPLSSIVDTTLASFNQVLSVNLCSVFTFTKEFLRRLELSENKDATGASIVNISSLAAKLGYLNLASYAASKAGVVAFTKTTCIEAGRFGVRCNALTPSWIDTSLLQTVDPAVIEGSIPFIPMGRIGKPIEVANACLFLASDESSYINGADLQVSGGAMA